MIQIIPKRIHIIGSVGSGKTYLARFLSEQLSIPYYQLDNVVWRKTRNGDVRNSDEDRDQLLKDIINENYWIVEGAHHKWVSESFEKSDLIIYVEPTKLSRDIRLFIRFSKQKLGLEQGNYNQTIKDLFKHFVWNKEFDSIKKPEIFTLLQPYMHKVEVIKNNKEIINDPGKWFQNHVK
ncbi:MAG: DNA topology modulation protein FlaR [Bacillota bacterium]